MLQPSCWAASPGGFAPASTTPAPTLPRHRRRLGGGCCCLVGRVGACGCWRCACGCACGAARHQRCLATAASPPPRQPRRRFVAPPLLSPAAFFSPGRHSDAARLSSNSPAAMRLASAAMRLVSAACRGRASSDSQSAINCLSNNGSVVAGAGCFGAEEQAPLMAAREAASDRDRFGACACGCAGGCACGSRAPMGAARVAAPGAVRRPSGAGGCARGCAARVAAPVAVRVAAPMIIMTAARRPRAHAREIEATPVRLGRNGYSTH